MIHPYNAEQIESITGLRQSQMSEEFVAEYTVWLRMFHRCHSGGGALPVALLIPLLRSFDMATPSPELVASQKTRWDQVEVGTRIVATVAGNAVKGKFLQLVSGGTLGVKLEGIDRVMELTPANVKIDPSVHADINYGSMVDDRGQPDARVKLLDNEPKSIDWTKQAGSPVSINGEEGILVGPTPKNPGYLTVEIGDELSEYTQDQVKLIETSKA